MKTNKKWAIYIAGNAEYALNKNQEPIKALNSFNFYFQNKIDCIYFTDENEPNLDKLQELCEQNNIKLITGKCKDKFNHYFDLEWNYKYGKQRWPDAMYWYIIAPDYLSDYDFLVKLDGDMLCTKAFNLNLLESDLPILVAEAPFFEKSPNIGAHNAGFQIINIKKYIEKEIKSLFIECSKNIDVFNSDTPVLNHLVLSKKVDVGYLPCGFNFGLNDIEQVKKLKYHQIENDVFIVHFVGAKPHQFINKNDGIYKDEIDMTFSVKEIFAKRYLQF